MTGAEELRLDKGRRLRPRPEPKLRPWKRDEVPLDAWFRVKGETLKYRLLQIGESHVGFMRGTYGVAVLIDGWEHSIDGGKTWLPCGVLE